MKAVTTSEFKERASKIHNGRYSYEKTNLENKDENGKVVITCSLHGDFKQDPQNHLRGIGCSKCANNVKKTNEEVVEEIKKVHGDRYIIPEDFQYLGNKKEIHMICPLHGDFYPIYHNFVKKGCGCKKCSCHIYSNEEFTEGIRNIYGENFIYTQVLFKGYRNKVIIKCSKCGKIHKVFPKRLLNGNFTCECTDSPYSVLENDIKCKLDELKIEYEYQFKANWLKYKDSLSLDFYLPKYKIGIECQGRFHFEPYKNNDFISTKNYNEQVERDKMKYQLCKNNGIKLIYYSNIQNKNYFKHLYNNVNELIKEIKY